MKLVDGNTFPKSWKVLNDEDHFVAQFSSKEDAVRFLASRDLLAACKAMSDRLHTEEERGVDFTITTDNVWEEMTVAIAKATL